MREFAAADGTAVCDRLTSRGQESVIQTIGPELTHFGINGCAPVVRVTALQLTRKQRRELRQATVGAVALNGPNATVPWSEISSPGGDVAAYFGRSKPISLVQSNGTWLIDSL